MVFDMPYWTLIVSAPIQPPHRAEPHTQRLVREGSSEVSLWLAERAVSSSQK